jgi:hypothetical protein
MFAMACPFRTARLITLIAMLMVSARLSAQDESADFEVREWVIFVADTGQPRLNAVARDYTLPAIAGEMPVSSPDEKPAPVGILRLSGTTDQRITLKVSGPSLLVRSHWPPAATRTVEVEWRNMSLSAERGPVAPLDPQHWLSPLRDGNYSHIRVGNRSERFLLYEANFLYVIPLKLAPSAMPDGRILATNMGTAPFRDLVLYRHVESGWTKGQAAQVPNQVEAGAEIILQPVAGSSPLEVCADWKQRLADCELDPTDLDLIVRILAAEALDERQMTAVYRMSNAELNALLKLEITPQPRHIRRVALVVVRNIDPALPALIESLIVQLGDKDWRKREAASRMLAQIGKAAEPKIRAALQSRDPEVAMRAERLLAPTRPATVAPQPIPAGTLFIR